MAWNPKGGGQGPWGGGGPGAQGPDIEEILRRGQDRFRRLSTVPMGPGQLKFSPGVSVPTIRPKMSSTPSSSGWTL